MPLGKLRRDTRGTQLRDSGGAMPWALGGAGSGHGSTCIVCVDTRHAEAGAFDISVLCDYDCATRRSSRRNGWI
ncbi:unnamed protein product, partial [Iphiclides podalirius]